MEENKGIYVQHPVSKSQLVELLNNAPVSVLTADVAAVKWLDELKRVARDLK